MVLNFDLNFPPDEETSGCINPQVASAESSKGLFVSPIYVESTDDEVELLSLSAPFLQRNQPTQKLRMTIDLEQAMEIPTAQSGVSIAEPAAILLSLSSPSNHEGTSTNRNNMDHQQYFDLEADHKTKWLWNNAMTSSHIEPQRVITPLLQPPPPPKEPTFSCPLCMDSLINPCSTFCGHIFCQSCIEASIAASVKKKAGKQCPTCRAKLPAKKSFHRVYLPITD